MGNRQAGKKLAILLARTARLTSKGDDDRTTALAELGEILNNPQTNKTRSQAVLDNKAAMDVLLDLSATTSSADVAENALGVLMRLARDSDNKRRLFQEYPSVVLVAMRKLEFGAENATEGAQERALFVLSNLANNINNRREMVTKNPTLVTLLVAKVESNSEKVQVGALEVLSSLAVHVDNAQEMATKNPTLVPLLVAKVESSSEQVQVEALFVLNNLAINVDNAREMFTKNPTLVPLLVAKVEFNLKQVQEGALDVLNNLTSNIDNAREMLTDYAKLVPLLVTKMNGNTGLAAFRVVYLLSCSPANRAILRGSNSVVAALTKGRENKDMNISLFSLLALVNLFGAEEDSKVLETDLEMLRRIFSLIARAMNKDGWRLNRPLLAFRYLCVVKHNRRLLWDKYKSEFLTSILAALQRAIDDKDAPAAENAMSTLAQFSSDPDPLAWMRSKKPRLDKVIVQLTPFPEALKTAQFLQLTLDPPKVATAPDQVAGSKPTIMISYNWKHQAQARLVHLLLESQGYPVWRDEVRMRGNIMDAMAEAVSESSVVLVLVSPWYVESANCKLECLFAHEHKRKLVPVMVEPGYKLGLNWLGLLFAGALYYDVSRFDSKVQMEPVVLNLLRGEVEGGQGAVAAAPLVPAVAAVATPKQPVPQDEKEIRQWLSKHTHDEEIANKLVKEDLVEARDLEILSKKSWGELKAILELNTKQALRLEAALKELF